MSDKEENDVDGEVPEISEATGEITHEPFRMKVFGTAKAQQAANGLRHNDHLRYRQYCTRRLRRLRCTLKWKNGKGKNKQVPFPSDFEDPRHLEFPLMCAERAWSYGVQLKADNALAATHQPRWRLHSIRRFAKALKWAQFLEEVVKRHGDNRTQKEAEAYSAFMAATLQLEKEEWAEALKNFQRCRKVCDHLALASEQEESALFKTHSQQLAPSIRECKYNLGQGYDENDGEDLAIVGKGSRAKGKEFEGQQYRGHSLITPPEKIKMQLLKCLELNSKIKVSEEFEDNNIIFDRYGGLSSELGDTLKDIHHDMINSNDTKDEKGEHLHENEWKLVEAFTRELSITMNVERNLVFLWNLVLKLDGLEEISSNKARATCRPEEGMRYCDMIKEDLDNLLELPDTSSDISKAIAAYVTVAVNCRCFFLALCHALTGKCLESAALFDMLRLRLEDCILEAALGGSLGRLHHLFERVVTSMPSRVAQWRCRGLAAMCGKGPNLKEADSQVPDVGAHNFPPIVQNIPCKPLLFDLAFPCIEEPDLEEFLKRAKGGDKGPGILGRVAGGVTGKLSGWWGKK